jgi:PAS domain S-box-containing protein
MLGSPADAEIYRRCFEDSTDGILVTDLAGKILSVNQAWLAMHLFDRPEVLGKTTRIVRSEHTTGEVYASMWSQIRDPAKGFWKGELVNRRKDGTELPVLLTITPVKDGARIAGYMAITIDRRDREELEELKRLYQLTVWHDLRSPLAAIRSLLEAAAAGLAGALTPDQQDLLERAVRQARRMSEMISTTLDLEKLKERKLQLDLRDDFDLFASVRASFLTLADQAKARQVRLELAGEGDRLTSRADPIHAQRCVDNLVKNAIEASPSGDTVSVRVEPADGQARLSVHNGGSPIPPEVRATLFHPFGTFGKRGGTGLGLYGVKLLAEAMSGAVSCQTGETGTTFTLLLPLGK